MSIARRVFYNTLMQSAGKIFAALVGLVTVAILSQHLRELGFGQYSTVVAYLGFFAVLADFGLYLYTVREISKPTGDHKQILSNAVGLRFTTSLVLLIAGALVAQVLPYDPVVKKTMFVGVAAFLFTSLNQVLIGVFQKHLVQYLVVVSETAGRVVNLAVIFFAIRYDLPLWAFIAAMILGNGAAFLLTLRWAKKYEPFSLAFDFVIWKQILKESWPLIFSVILNLLYFKADTVILSFFRTQEEVGIYSLPYKLLEGLLAFPAMFVGLVMPILSRTAFASWTEFRQIWQRAFDALVLMGILVIVVFEFFAKEIIFLLERGQGFADSAGLLQILILAVMIIFCGTLFGYTVVAVNEQRAMIKGYLLGAVLGLALYFVLIPNFGYWGAAWGTVATEAVVAVYAYNLVSKRSGQNLSFRIIARSAPAALALAGFFYFVSLPWILEIILGGVLYIGLLLMLKAIPPAFVREVLFLDPKPPADEL